ncbi:RHS repeat-associated core domain-containing protein, partial [Pseudomonas moorei]|uniref:RHS repeat-associated core domain-containing protein n=1 Tax=Pseudomonas moorei TaxID=395599 RepID=UPI0024B263D9
GGDDRYPKAPLTANQAISESALLFDPIGFNGYLLDRTTGCYILGNGYRLYSPTLQAFYSPDAVSPFGAGGVNRYQYCGLDPVNNTDPIGSDWTKFKRWVLPWLSKGFVGAAADMFRGGAETIRENDPSYQPDQTRGDAYDPKSARILDQVASGIDIAGFFVGNMVSAAMPALGPGKVGVGTKGVEGNAWRGGTSRAAAKIQVAVSGYTNRARNAFKYVRNNSGSRVWLTQYRTRGSYAEGPVYSAVGRGRQVSVLSGTHGDRYGLRLRSLREQQFYLEDVRRYRHLNGVTVFDVGSMSSSAFENILQGPSEVVAAFCYSRNDSAIRSILKLRPKISYTRY